MTRDDRILLGAICWSTIGAFLLLWNLIIAGLYILLSAVFGLYIVLPLPKPKTKGQKWYRPIDDGVEQLQRFLEEAEYEATRLAEIGEKYGPEKREKVEELLRQKQALSKMEEKR